LNYVQLQRSLSGTLRDLEFVQSTAPGKMQGQIYLCKVTVGQAKNIRHAQRKFVQVQLLLKMPSCKYCNKGFASRLRRHEERCNFKACKLCKKEFRGLRETAIHFYMDHVGE